MSVSNGRDREGEEEITYILKRKNKYFKKPGLWYGCFANEASFNLFKFHSRKNGEKLKN